MNKKKAVKRKVVCAGCSFLYKKFCLLKANFKDSPLERKTDLTGVRMAETVNKNLNCKFKKRLPTLLILEVKAWVKRKQV